MKKFGFGVESAALLVVTIWGTNFVFQKALLAELDPMVYIFLRYLGMIALAWLVLLVQKRFAKPAPTPAPTGNFKQDLPKLLLAGILGYTFYIPLSIVGLNYTTAFSGALLIGTAPLFTALLLHLFKLEQIRSRQWLALAVALAGLIVFVSDKIGGGIQLGTLGDVISLASAFAYAAYLVANKPLLSRYSAAQLTAYTLTLGSIPLLLISLPFVFSQDWTRMTVVGWLTLAWATVFPVYFAWSVWSWVNAKIGVARSSLFMYLVPLIGGITSWVLLGENFGWLKILGAGLILSGIILARKSQQAKKAEVQAAVKPELVGTSR
jgi:drug/metabolite transporter (DMT)-like permease